MTCWKTINLTKDYGFHRIILISLISMFIAFILFYLPMNLMFSSIDLKADGSIYFFMAVLFLYPLHAFLHVLPFWMTRKKLAFSFKWMYGIPFISKRSKKSLSKPFMILVMVTPFLFLTTLMIVACMAFPGYIHYFSIVAAINFGLCVPDFIYLSQFIKAPRSCTVEEIEDGYDILIHN